MADGASTFAQFVRFGTDVYGIERLLRLFQALAQILICFPVLAAQTTAAKPAALDHLRRRLALLRQPLRFFRFLDSFAAAWAVWPPLTLIDSTTTTFPSSSSPSVTSAAVGGGGGGGGGGAAPSQDEASEKRSRNETPTQSSRPEPSRPLLPGSAHLLNSVHTWADFAARSFNGVYLLLESLTFADLVLDPPPGLAVWGAPRARALAADGQRFWFAALVCGVVCGVASLARDSWADREAEPGREKETGKGKGERDKGRIIRRIVADVLDLAIPGSVVGWLRLPPAVVGLCMLGSTVLTGLEVWERCGREVAAR